jgi:hypothetical protein
MPREKTQPSGPGSKIFNWTGKGLNELSLLHNVRAEIMVNMRHLFLYSHGNRQTFAALKRDVA